MKNRRFQLYLLGLLVLFGAYVVAEYNRPKPVDRTPTFINHDKIPYGTYALFDLLPDLFKRPVQTIREPIFNQLYPGASPDYPSIDSSQTFAPDVNYCFVNSIFKLDSLDCNALLRFVASGNNVFIAAEDFDSKLSDTLHFDIDTYARVGTLRNGTGVLRTDSVTLRFTADGPVPQRRFRYPRQVAAAHFLLDSAVATSTCVPFRLPSPTCMCSGRKPAILPLPVSPTCQPRGPSGGMSTRSRAV
jgi:hypothetical protein